MKYKFILIGLLLLLSCQTQQSKPLIVVTNRPLMMIVQEIIGNKVQLECLTQSGDSPHTYSPKPSDAAKAAKADVFLYTAKTLDEWAIKMNAKNKIEVFSLLPKNLQLSFDEACCEHTHGEVAESQHEHSEGNYDPHFWLDPLTVKSLLPALTDTLSKLFPEYSKTFANNSELFAKRLDLLNKQVGQILSGKEGRSLFTFHPSFRYFIARYGLAYGGSIEVSPGKEPSPKFLVELSDKIKQTGTRAIFSEPQLSISSAKAVAEATGTILFELDPLGGVTGRTKYSDLIIYNAKILQKAL